MCRCAVKKLLTHSDCFHHFQQLCNRSLRLFVHPCATTITLLLLVKIRFHYYFNTTTFCVFIHLVVYFYCAVPCWHNIWCLSVLFVYLHTNTCDCLSAHGFHIVYWSCLITELTLLSISLTLYVELLATLSFVFAADSCRLLFWQILFVYRRICLEVL